MSKSAPNEKFEEEHKASYTFVIRMDSQTKHRISYKTLQPNKSQLLNHTVYTKNHHRKSTPVKRRTSPPKPIHKSSHLGIHSKHGRNIPLKRSFTPILHNHNGISLHGRNRNRSETHGRIRVKVDNVRREIQQYGAAIAQEKWILQSVNVESDAS